MKKLLILLLCTVVLSACGSDDTEISEETTIHTDTAEITVISQTDEKTEQETSVPADGEPVTESTTVTETTPVETSPVIEELSEDGSVRLIEEIYGLPKISKGYLISYVTDRGDEVTNTTENVECTVKLHDVKTGEFVTEFPMPKGYKIEDIVVGGDGLCSVVLYCYSEDDSSETGFSHEYCAAYIHNDFSIGFAGYTAEAKVFNHYERKLAEFDMGIIDAVTEETLIEGNKNEDNYYANQWISYMFPIDENRFVYRIGGVECLPGFGIYDFSTGTAMDVPDSKDLIPFGVYDGKIYSAYSAWDGFGTDIYITDTETLETELYIDLDTEGVFNGYRLNHFMYNGEIFILGEYQYAKLFKLTPDGAEIVYEYPEKYYSFFRTDIDTESGILYSNYAIHEVGNGAILVDLNML